MAMRLVATSLPRLRRHRHTAPKVAFALRAANTMIGSVGRDLTPGLTRQTCRTSKLFGGSSMSWKSPKVVEIALGAEINSYACAETSK
jgi:coenzyme PQQ precursor peptide PqqA